MVKVRKLFGSFADKVKAGGEIIEFDENGVAEVSEEVADILEQIPNEYEFVLPSEGAPDAPEAPDAPAKAPTAPKRTAPATNKAK
jgi:hypothetical protein